MVETEKGEEKEGEKKGEEKRVKEEEKSTYFARLINEIYTGVKSLNQLLVDKGKISDSKYNNVKEPVKNTNFHDTVDLGSLPSVRHQRQRVGSMSELRDHSVTDYIYVPYYPQYCVQS